MKYYGGCDVGSTYTKAVILDGNGKIAASVIQRSKMNAAQSSQMAMDACVSQVSTLNSVDLYRRHGLRPQPRALRGREHQRDLLPRDGRTHH